MIFLAVSAPGLARVVGVNEWSGSGFLFNHRGNCFVILPTHLHGQLREGIAVSAPGGREIGTATVFYVAPDEVDLSVGFVRGSIANDCGPDWNRLPRRLNETLSVGDAALLKRARQASTEGRRVLVHTVTFDRIRLEAAPGEADDLYGGTSGSVVFADDVPIGIVLEAETRAEVYALRMDEIVNRVSRYMGEVQNGPICGAGDLPDDMIAGCPPPAPSGPGLRFEVLSWSTHPVGGAQDPVAMAAGQGPYVAPIGPGRPIVIEIGLTEADRLHRVQILSLPSDGAFVPKSIDIVSDPTGGPIRRPNPFPARDMAPDGNYDNQVGERFARTVTIHVTSTWGGGSPARIDKIILE